MKFSRPARFTACLIALSTLLFMQLAVAFYACPGNEMSAGVESHGMPGCAGMDMAQPGLCQAHAHVGDQSLDKPALPLVQAFIPVGLGLALNAIEPVSHPSFQPPASLLLTRATAPPIAIRHCCFRI